MKPWPALVENTTTLESDASFASFGRLHDINEAGASHNSGLPLQVLRAKSSEPTHVLRVLTYPVLLRLATLQFLRAVARACPEAFRSPDAADADAKDAATGGAAGATRREDQITLYRTVREYAIDLCFDCLPKGQLSGAKPGEPVWTNSNVPMVYSQTGTAGEERLYDKNTPPVAPSTGHSHLIFAATHRALSAIVNVAGLNPLHNALHKIAGYVNSTDFKALNFAYAEAFGCIVANPQRKSDFFNSHIADRLLENVQKWINVHSIRDQLGNTGREPDFAASIMNLFHLLPLDIDRVLPEFAKLTGLLDAKLHQFRSKGVLSTPFRKPFARFLSAYPVRCFDWFSGERRLLNACYGRLFTAAAALPDAGGLHTYLRSPEGFARLEAETFPPDHAENYSFAERELLALRGLQLLAGAACAEPSWVARTPAVAELILRVWYSPLSQKALHSALGETPRAPWHASRQIWGGAAPVPRLLAHMLVTMLRGAVGAARATAAARATGAEPSAAAVEQNIPAPLVVRITTALLGMLRPSCRIPWGYIRAALEFEVATVPCGALRSALLSTYLALPDALAADPVRASAAATGVDADSLHALALRVIVQPLLRHTVALEEEVAGAFAAGGESAGTAAYIAAGGPLEALQAAPKGRAVVGVSVSAHHTAAVLESAADVHMRTPSTAVNGAQSGFSLWGSGRSGVWSPSSGGWRSAPFTPFSPSTGTAASAGISWSEATYLGSAAAATSSFRFAAEEKENAAASDPSPHEKTTFAPLYPFPRLLGTAWLDDVAKLLTRIVPDSKVAVSAVPGGATSEGGGAADALGGGVSLNGDATSSQSSVPDKSTGGGHVQLVLPIEYRAELLRIADTALAAFGHEVTNANLRKTFIRFAWHHLRVEEPACKLWGYCVMARYAQVFEVPVKLLLQVLHGMLSVASEVGRCILLPGTAVLSSSTGSSVSGTLLANNTSMGGATAIGDGRELLFRALNIYLPTLALRMPRGEWRKTIKLCRKAIMDESHSIPSITLLWSIVLKHQALFFPLRHTFVGYVISTNHKLLQQASINVSQKNLVSDLMTMLSVWQAHGRLAALTAGTLEKGAPAADAPSPQPSPDAARSAGVRTLPPQYPTSLAEMGDWTLTCDLLPKVSHAGASGSTASGRGALVEFAVNFTARAAVLASDSQVAITTGATTVLAARALSRHALNLFGAMIRLWPDCHLQPAYLQKQQSSLHPLRRGATGATPTAAALDPSAEDVAGAASYHATILEILLMTSASEGRARDFIVDYPGFTMDLFVNCCASSDKRVQTLIRRLVRRYLSLYPQDVPPPRLQHVRFYPWLASSIALRLGTYLGFDIARVTDHVKTVAEHVDVSADVRSRSKDVSRVLKYISENKIMTPGCDPQKVAEARTAADSPAGEKPGSAGAADESKAPFPGRVPIDWVRATEIANASWPGFTPERARALLQAEAEDDTAARQAWSKVKSVAEAPAGVAGEYQVLAQLRLFRDILKYAPVFSFALNAIMQRLFEQLMRYTIECEEYLSKQARNELSTLTFALQPSNDPHQDPELRNIRAMMLCVIIPCLCSRSVFLSPWKSVFVNYIGRLSANSSDPGLLRTCFRVLETWLSVSTPIARAHISQGLSYREKVVLLEQSLGFLAIPYMGSHNLHRDVIFRIQKLPSDVYQSLQADYYQMILRLYTGDNHTGLTLASAQAFVAASERPPGAAGRPSTVGWVTHLQKAIIVGMLCSNLHVRTRCFNLVLAGARERRAREMREELARLETLRASHHASFRALAAKRRSNVLSGPTASLASFPVANPFRGARLPVTSQEAATNAQNNFEGAVRYSVTVGESEDTLHANLDADTAALLEAAYASATGTGPTLAAADSRPRLVAFAGLEAPSVPVEAAPGALSALQDVLITEWEAIAGFSWIPQIARMMLGAVGFSAGRPPSPLVPPPPTPRLASAALTAIAAAQALALAGPADAATARRDFANAVGEAATYSADLSLSMWNALFPAAWAAVSPRARARLTPHVSALLLKDLPPYQSVQLSPLSQLETALGVLIKDRDREQGGALYAGDAAWSISAGSSATTAAAIGAGALVLGAVEESSSGAVLFPAATYDIITASNQRLLSTAIFSAQPAVAVPSEVLTTLARSYAGMQDYVLPAAEAAVEAAVATVHVGERRLLADEKALANLRAAVHIAPQPPTSAASDGIPYTTRELTEKFDFSGPSFVEALAPTQITQGLALVERTDRTRTLHSAISAASTRFLESRRALAQEKFILCERVTSLAGAYSALSLDDLARGLRRRFAATIATARAIDFEAQGMWPEASETYLAALVEARDLSDRNQKERHEVVTGLNKLVAAASASVVAQASTDAGAAGARVEVPQTTATAAQAAPSSPSQPADGAPPTMADGDDGVAPPSPPSATPQIDADAQTPLPSTTLAPPPAQPDAVPDGRVTDVLLCASASVAGNSSSRKRRSASVGAGDASVGTGDATYAASRNQIIRRALPTALVNVLLAPVPASLPPDVSAVTGGGSRRASKASASQVTRALAKAVARVGAGGAAGASPDVQMSEMRATLARFTSGPDDLLPRATSARERRDARLALLGSLTALEPLAPIQHVVNDSEIVLAYLDLQATGPLTRAPAAAVPLPPLPDGSTATALAPTPTAVNPWATSSAPRWELPPSAEVDLWEDRWTESMRQLCQWPVLREYAQKSGDAVLLVEAQSKQGEWGAVRNAQQTAPAVSVEANRSHATKLVALESLVIDLRCNDASSALDDVFNLWLRQWQALPPIPSPAHSAMLAQSQRVREAHEAISVALGIEKVLHVNGQNPPDLKNVILTWRDRLPNRWDGALSWESLLTWRTSVYNLITESLRSILHEDTTTASVHDAPWTLIKLAHVARKLGLRDLAQATLAKLQQHTALDVHDVFARTKERCLLYMPDKATVAAVQVGARKELYKRALAFATNGPASSTQRGHDASATLPRDALALVREGLVFAQKMEFDVFSERQRAEIFRIKAVFFENLGDAHWPSAYEAFAAGALHSHAYGKIWLDWAHFLERLYQRVAVEARLPPAADPPSPAAPDVSSAPAPHAAEMQTKNPVIFTAELVANFVGAGVTDARGAGVGGDDDMGESGAGGPTAPPHVAPMPTTALPAVVAAQAVAAFLHAISLNCKLAPLHFARVLALVASEEAAAATSAIHAAAKLCPPAALPPAASAPTSTPPLGAGSLLVGAPILAALFNGAGALPAWVWIPWIPQLIAGLHRPEVDTAKRALHALAYAYPQALFFPLRSACKEVADSRAPPTAATSAAEQTLQLLRRCHPPSHDLEQLVDEVSTRCTTRLSLEEDMLMNVVNQLRHAMTAVHVLQSSRLRDAADGASVMTRAAAREAELLRSTLGALSKYAASKLVVDKKKPRGIVARTASRVRRAFALDLCGFVAPEFLTDAEVASAAAAAGSSAAGDEKDNPERHPRNPHAPKSMEELIARLRVWRARLLEALALRGIHAACDSTVALAPELMSAALLGDIDASADIEVPGQYARAPPAAEPVPARHVRIVAVEPQLLVILNSGGGVLQRRVGFIGDDGRRHAFLMQTTGGASTAAADARIGQAFSMLSAVLGRHHAARARSLALPSFETIPWSPRLRLVPDAPGALSLSDALDRALESPAAGPARAGAPRSADELLDLYRRTINAAAADAGAARLSPDEASAVGFAAAARALPASALSATISAASASPEALAALRARFANAFAMHSLACFLFSITDRSPSKISLSLATGGLTSIDPRPAYAPFSVTHGAFHTGSLLDVYEAVPFRLTRNFVHFLSPQGVSGPVAASIVAASRGLCHHYEWLLAYLTVFFRDEVSAFWAARPPALHSLLPASIVRAASEGGAGAADGLSVAGASSVGGGDDPKANPDPLAPPALSSSNLAGAVDAGNLYRRSVANAFRESPRTQRERSFTAPLNAHTTPDSSTARPPPPLLKQAYSTASWTSRLSLGRPVSLSSSLTSHLPCSRQRARRTQRTCSKRGSTRSSSRPCQSQDSRR